MTGHIRTRRHERPNAGDRFLPGNWLLISEAKNGAQLLLSVTVPTASRPNGLGDALLTPTLALDKSRRGFDVQTTFGANLPAGDAQLLGRQLLWNTTFQYRADWKPWPELEANATLL